MLRVHLTAEDLAQVRLLPAVGPMAETSYSLTALRRGSGRPNVDPWRQRVREVAGSWMVTVGALAPAHTAGFELLGIGGVRQSFEAGAEALLRAGPGVLFSEPDLRRTPGTLLLPVFGDPIWRNSRGRMT